LPLTAFGIIALKHTGDTRAETFRQLRQFGKDLKGAHDLWSAGAQHMRRC
jgi:hypothetical protein